MLISDERIILRDFRESDIEKRIFWETVETEWQLWDAPWEYEDLSDEKKKKELDDYIANMHTWVQKYDSMDDGEKRTTFQICIKGENNNEEYIGWCSSYRIDDDCKISTSGDKCAIGIDIPQRDARGKGYAYNAMCLFIDYLLSNGETDIYTQTWSGNTRMIGLAKKLGFEEYTRKPDLRTVRGQKYDGLTFRLNLEFYQESKQKQIEKQRSTLSEER